MILFLNWKSPKDKAAKIGRLLYFATFMPRKIKEIRLRAFPEDTTSEIAGILLALIRFHARETKCHQNKFSKKVAYHFQCFYIDFNGTYIVFRKLNDYTR